MREDATIKVTCDYCPETVDVTIKETDGHPSSSLFNLVNLNLGRLGWMFITLFNAEITTRDMCPKCIERSKRDDATS